MTIFKKIIPTVVFLFSLCLVLSLVRIDGKGYLPSFLSGFIGCFSMLNASFLLLPKYVAWSSNYIVRYQLEIVLQQTITNQFDVPFPSVNINSWHCFSHYHLHI